MVRARADLKVNTREVPGEGANPWILQLYRDLRLTETSDEKAWCSIYACRTLLVSGVKPWRRLRAARGALEWGEPTEFRVGAIGVKRRLVNGQDDGVHGHVFFGLSCEDGVVRALGGNQHNRVSISEYPVSDMLGWRWPKPSDYLVPR